MGRIVYFLCTIRRYIISTVSIFIISGFWCSQPNPSLRKILYQPFKKCFGHCWWSFPRFIISVGVAKEWWLSSLFPSAFIDWNASIKQTFFSSTIKFSSGQFSRSVVSNSQQPHKPQDSRPPCPSPTPRVYPNPCLLSRWCHPTISSSVMPFSSCPQSFPASGSFPMSQLFTLGDWSVRVSASASVLPMNTQNWSPLRWTGWISLQSKGLSIVFSNTTDQKHQFFSGQLSSRTNSHIHTWPLEKP